MLDEYTTPRERSFALVFLTAFSIPFLVGLLRIDYPTATGFVALVALGYLGYRAILYRPARYAHARLS